MHNFGSEELRRRCHAYIHMKMMILSYDGQVYW